jgi:DMSO/TMAO reductase YedYZ molybdopterin-dependent catalytic subunit
MINLSRRKLLVSGLAATAGASGLAVAARLGQKYGLVPPDHGGIYGLGETLTYASQRLLTRHSLAREFPRSRISPCPFPNELAPLTEEFKRLQAGRFADWRLSVDGLVAEPASFSIADLKSYPSRSHITELACEEGWSYIAEWIGVPLSHVLNLVGVHPQAKYVVYSSMEPDTWDSIDMADALHPQTFLSYGMNGNELPVVHGGPLRMRLPRQVGYKNIKFINRLTVTDSLKGLAKASALRLEKPATPGTPASDPPWTVEVRQDLGRRQSARYRLADERSVVPGKRVTGLWPRRELYR